MPRTKREDVLTCTITFNKNNGAQPLTAVFEGDWTGREVTKVQAKLFLMYRQYQRARAKAGATNLIEEEAHV